MTPSEQRRADALADAETLRPSVEGHRPYRGVLRSGRKIVWRANHTHANRDLSPSAHSCAASVLRYMQNEELAESILQWTGWRYAEDAEHEAWAVAEGRRLRAVPGLRGE